MKLVRNILIVIGALVFGFTLVGISVVRDQANSVKTKPTMIVAGQPTYFLELAQDRITDWLTFDKNKKIALWLSFADNRFQTAKNMFENHQESSALLVIRKAIGYQTQTVSLLEEMKLDSLNNISDYIETTQNSMNKGRDLLEGWQKDGQITNSSEYDSLLKLINSGLERLRNMRS